MFANWEICWKRMVCVLLELNMVESYTFTKQKSKKKHGGHDSWLAVDLHQWWFFLLPLRLSFKMTHPRSLTVRPREVSFPKGKDHLPTIHFQGGFVKLWGVCIVFFQNEPTNLRAKHGPKLWSSQYLGYTGHPPSGGLELNHGSDITSKAMYHRIEQVGGGWRWWTGVFGDFEKSIDFFVVAVMKSIDYEAFTTNSWTQKGIFQKKEHPTWDDWKEHIMRFNSTNFFVTSFILCLWGHPSQFETVGLTKMGVAIASILSRWFCFGLRLLSTKGSSWW